MKRATNIMGKLIAKTIMFFVLTVLTIFTAVFKIFKAIYKFVAIPFALICIGYACLNIFIGEASASNYYAIIFALFLVALRYLLTPIVNGLDHLNESIRIYVFAPIFIRPPVRYTI